jgi:hypothetical protein
MKSAYNIKELLFKMLSILSPMRTIVDRWIAHVLRKTIIGGLYDGQKEDWIQSFQGLARRNHSLKDLRVLINSFSSNNITLVKDRERKPGNSLEITVVCPVKNDLTYLKRFLPYYRNLGATGFIFIDNESSDGSREFLLKQPDVTLFSCPNPYNHFAKDGWVCRAIAYNGLNQWYLVLDSDEFLSYPGMENSQLDKLIRTLEENGIKAARGFMLDMYPDYPLFSKDKDPGRFMEDYRYFDPFSKWYNKNGDKLIGGMRARVLGVYTALQKTSLMRCSKGVFPYESTHNMNKDDGVAEGMFYVLRHYKFLPGDYDKMKATAVKNTGYYSAERQRSYLSLAGVNVKDDNSLRYADSTSLTAFPFIKELIKKE